MSETNKAFVKRFCEDGLQRVVKGDLKAIHEYLSPGFIRHTASHSHAGKHGADEFALAIAESVKALPDLQFGVEDYVADGDLVVTHWRIAGKHTGHHKHRHADEHVAPSGADANIEGLSMYRVAGGQIVEAWSFDNHLDFLISAGAMKVS